MIDFRAVFVALAARFAPGTISTPTGAVAMRASYPQSPKDIPTVPCAFVDVQDGVVIANDRWEHHIDTDVVFLLSKRPGDPARVDEQRQRWLGSLLAATERQLKLGIGAQSGYELAKALPTGWEFTEYAVGATEFDAIRIHFRLWIYETVDLLP